MSRRKFQDIIINSRERRAPLPGDEKNYITVTHLIPHRLDIPEWGIDEPFEDERLIIKPGDVLFITQDPQNHQVAVSPIDGLFTGYGMVIRPVSDVIDPEFLPYFITSDTFINEAVRISVGTKFKRVNWGELKELYFDLPDMDMQKKLVTVMKKIEKLMQYYSSLESDLKASVYSFFYEKILTSSDTKFLALGELMSLHTESIYFESAEHERYITYEELINNAGRHRTKNGSFYGYRLEEGQLAATRQTFYKNGTALVTNEFSGAVISNQTQIFNVHQDLILPDYLQYMTTSENFLNQLEAMDLSAANWNYTFSKKKIAVPPLEIQRKFMDYYHKIQFSLQKLHKCKEDTYELFQSTLCEHIKV